MADGGGESQLTYTQDNVSVRLLGPQGEDTVAGKLEITKERHGHVVSWAAYPPAVSKEGEQRQQQRYDLDATGIWEDLSADSAVSYHVGSRRSRDRCESTDDTLQIRREEAESGCSGDPPPSPVHGLSFEVTELASYRCRQVGDKHELTLNLHDGTRLPTLVFLERRHDHFVRALHEHVTFKRSDPDDANALVCVSAPLRATSPATEDATGDGWASPASSPSASKLMSHESEPSVSKTTMDQAVDQSAGPADSAPPPPPPPPAAFTPGVHTLRFFLPRAPNVTVVPGTAGGPAKLVPGPQAVRLLLSQAASSHPPQPVAAHPVQLLVQPPAESFPSGLVISDVRSQADVCSPPPPSAPPAVAALRRRGPHWPPEEKLELLSLLRQRRHLVNPRLAEGVSKKEKLDGWKEVTDTLNRHHSPIGGGGRRCVAEVKKQWQNLFLKAKRERREMLSDAATAGKGVESTSLQLSVLSLKVFETFGDNYGAPEDECALPEDLDASNSILGPSSCLEPDGPFLSESHHPEVILLPRSPDVAEQQARNNSAPLPQGSPVMNGEGSGHASRRRPSSDCLAGPWGIKREKREAPDEGLPEDDAGRGREEEESGGPFHHRGGGPALNGHSLLGPLAKTCEVVQQAATEVLSLRRREHKMKMAALRAKVDYYELKKRKLLLQQQQAAAR